MLSEISQTKKKTNTLQSHLHVEPRKTKLIDTGNRFGSCLWWGLGVGKTVEGVKRCKLPVI